MTKSYTAIVIDDEIRARTLLTGMLGEYSKHIAVLAECEDLPHGVKSIRKHKPDLVFLDIEMPGHSGLELLDFFNEDEIDFKIIFTTAYNEYAIKAFKLSAIDYLLKPIDAEELQTAIARFEKIRSNSLSNLAVLKENFKTPDVNKIAVPTGNTFRFIELDTMLYLKADNSYTEIHFTDGTKLIVSRTLKNFEEALDSTKVFFRCHKSSIVNLKYVTDFVKGDGGYILLNGKISISISPEKVDELLAIIKTIKR